MRKMILAAAAFGSVLLAVACGGGISQSQECKDYITCADKIGASAGSDSIDTSFGPMSTCWTAGVQSSADACTASCKTGLSGLKTSFPDAGC